ncbi:peptide chain release factor N(5)-glutamine methyltransferase [Rheinheimera sp.]|uniref:peptide chain release factor N(5)-glutamine methyltransferase n=1 Tax=Rheinheimera sp. TaxID=1869214 RepID=UPI00307FA3CA
MQTVRQWLLQASSVLHPLVSTGPVPVDARQEARRLLQELSGWSATQLVLRENEPLDPALDSRLTAALQRRLQGEPLAYILGYWYFWDFQLKVAPCTLIPRPDTETLVRQALELTLPAQARVLDLGTGTGAIVLALAKERPDWQLTGLDLQPEAVALAQHNATQLQLTNCQFVQSNWFSAVQGQQFDLIVSNPPYIDEADPHLSQGDVAYEPRTALVAAGAGLADIQQIIQGATQHLSPQGWLWLEHGYQQADAVQQLLQQAGFRQVQSVRDYGGQWRISGGLWVA